MLIGAVRENVPVVQVIDLDVLDVVAVYDVHLAIDGAAFLGLGRGRSRRRPGARRGFDRRNVDMLNALLRLELGVYPRGGRGCTTSWVSTTIFLVGAR